MKSAAKIFGLTAVLLLGWSAEGHAQLQRVPACGNGSIPAGVSPGTQDPTGRGCINISPGGITPTPAAGAILAGNTFQTALAASASRKFCIIQNTSLNTLYVYDGVKAQATLLKSLQISPGDAYYCQAAGGTVTLNEISVTTTTTNDPFVVDAQQ